MAKTVRLAVGALGGASVLSLIAPMTTATAAAGSGQASRNTTGKSVALMQHNGLARPAAACNTDLASPGRGNNSLYGAISFNGTCVGFQSASIPGWVTGLTERVKFWNGSTLELTKWVNPGHLSTEPNGDKFTRFYSSPDYHATEVCEALVPNSNHNVVYYGPACEHTP